MIELELPWPDRALHPNARVHWANRAKATKIARAFAHMKVKECGWRLGQSVPTDGRLALHLEFYPPDRRKRDDDGAIASCKAYRDGIADAMGIDDNRFVSHPRVMDEVVKGGLVRIRIVPEEA